MAQVDAGRPPGPATSTCVLVLITGITVAIAGVVGGVLPYVHTLTSARAFPVPGQAIVHLSAGQYVVYERTSGSTFGFSSGRADITPNMVTVTSETGESVVVESPDSTTSRFPRNGDEYVGAVMFAVSTAGDYTVRVDSPSAGAVIVARPIESTLRHSLGWWLLALFGAGIALTGTVMWIIGASHRRRHRLLFGTPGMYALPPPAWYPDPEQSGRLRYWDGVRWTDHTH